MNTPSFFILVFCVCASSVYGGRNILGRRTFPSARPRVPVRQIHVDHDAAVAHHPRRDAGIETGADLLERQVRRHDCPLAQPGLEDVVELRCRQFPVPIVLGCDVVDRKKAVVAHVLKKFVIAAQHTVVDRIAPIDEAAAVQDDAAVRRRLALRPLRRRPVDLPVQGVAELVPDRSRQHGLARSARAQ